MRKPLRTAIAPVALAVSLLATAEAGAHGRGAAQGYVATFSAVEPNVVGVLVNVYGPTNRFRLTNYSGKTLVILGARREPYLRFAASGVYENAASPTAYLNASRPVPASADPEAEPRWRKVAAGGASYTWHEHRIVWTDDEPPPVVRKAPDEPHLIRNWSIPATADDKPFRVNGLLGWAPPPPSESEGVDALVVVAIAAGAVVALAAIGATLWRRARRPA